MVKNIVKNTILTDFLKAIEDADTGKSASKLPKGTIKQFKGYKISTEEDSLSYMVMVSPYPVSYTHLGDGGAISDWAVKKLKKLGFTDMDIEMLERLGVTDADARQIIETAKVPNTGNGPTHFIPAYDPVSYTHLDVYKRQVQR